MRCLETDDFKIVDQHAFNIVRRYVVTKYWNVLTSCSRRLEWKGEDHVTHLCTVNL